jgi:hypothetical protein
MSNRPMHMIQEGCDAGILPGKITDESVIARPAGKITLSRRFAFPDQKSAPGETTQLPQIVALALAFGRPILELKASQALCTWPRRANASYLAGADFRRIAERL